MKIRTYLIKLFGGKIGKQILEISEGIAAIIEILGPFDFFVANRILYKNIAPPVATVFVGVIILTTSSYGKCVYTYPDKDFRLYPDIPRDTEHWDNLYRTRVTAHRTINLLKDTFRTAHRKTFNTLSLKADIFLSGIVQLVGVLLADALHKPNLIKSVRKLIA